MPNRVMLADHDLLVRQAMKAALERQGFQVVGEAADGLEAVEVARESRADIALLAVLLPQLNGLEAARLIGIQCPTTSVILVAEAGDEDRVLEALQDGVRAYVLKTQPIEELFEAIREVTRGGIYIGPRSSKAVIAAFRAARILRRDPLSHRERQVLQLVAEGRTTKEVATLLKISVRTADFHRTRLMQKLNVHSAVGLTRYAIRHGVVPP